MKTYTPKVGDVHAQRKWHLVDAEGKVLGRLASEVAFLLQGKQKAYYSPHLNMGDFVVVVNASRIKVTGDKPKKKVYFWHSGYPGGIKKATLEEMNHKKPTWAVEHAIEGMLPKNRLRKRMMRRLHIYPESWHPHKVQLG
jgi:large subunit ribosomal protein L13